MLDLREVIKERHYSQQFSGKFLLTLFLVCLHALKHAPDQTTAHFTNCKFVKIVFYFGRSNETISKLGSFCFIKRSALSHMRPMSLSLTSPDRPASLSHNVLEEIENFLHSVVR